MRSVDIEAEKQKIKEAYDFWIENEISHDIEAAMSVISDDATFLLPGIEPVKGGKALRKLGENFVETLVGGTWDVGHIEMASSGDASARNLE
jgi:ketosteroid isomerase-like protein